MCMFESPWASRRSPKISSGKERALRYRRSAPGAACRRIADAEEGLLSNESQRAAYSHQNNETKGLHPAHRLRLAKLALAIVAQDGCILASLFLGAQANSRSSSVSNLNQRRVILPTPILRETARRDAAATPPAQAAPGAQHRKWMTEHRTKLEPWLVYIAHKLK
jgi:hypothetical protein